MAKIKLSKKWANFAKKKSLQKLLQNRWLAVSLGLGVLLVIAYFARGLLLAATVNGQPIGRLTVINELERRGGSEVLDTLITQALINQEARKQNVNVTQLEVDATVAEIEASLEGQGGLEQILASEGMTRADLERQVKLQQLAEKLLSDKLTVTDEEAAEYLQANSDFLPEDASEEELNELARNQLRQEKLSSAIQVWLSDLRANSEINYFVGY